MYKDNKNSDKNQYKKNNIINDSIDENNVEIELCKIILANCATGCAIIAGIRKEKETGKPVLVSTVGIVSKDGKKMENFYIPMDKVVNFLKKYYNHNKNFSSLKELKKSFGELLSKMAKGDKEKVGFRFLGIDGLCYYLGCRMKDLPRFDMTQCYNRLEFSKDIINNKTKEIEKKTLHFYDIDYTKAVGEEDMFTNEVTGVEPFKELKLLDNLEELDIDFDEKYEVENYPITKKTQREFFEKHSKFFKNFKIDEEKTNGSNIFVFAKYNGEEKHQYAENGDVVNLATLIIDLFTTNGEIGRNNGDSEKYKETNSFNKSFDYKYCPRCNGLYNSNRQCCNSTEVELILDSSLEIHEKDLINLEECKSYDFEIY